MCRAADEEPLCSSCTESSFLLCVFVFVSHSSTLSSLPLLPGSHNCSDKLCDSWQLPGKCTLPVCVHVRCRFILLISLMPMWRRWNVSCYHCLLSVMVLKRQLWVYFLIETESEAKYVKHKSQYRSRRPEKICFLKDFVPSRVCWVLYFLCKNSL